MSFTWPVLLVLLLAAPIVLGAYLYKLHRRRKQAVSYSSVALLRSVLPKGTRWRRHLPIGLLVGSLAVLGIAAARPQMTRRIPIGRTSIILALDVSRSMCATDVTPNRISAAQKAARDFVEHQAPGTRTGLVVFSGSAQLAVPPTTDKKQLLQAIDGLTTGLGTAIGAAMLKSLDAIAAVNGNVKPVGDVSGATSGTGGGANGTNGSSSGSAPTQTPAKPSGGYVPDIVVLLTDGANNRGIAPLDAVPFAVDRRVRIYTIGFGTTTPAPLVCSAAQVGSSGQGGGFGFGGGGGGGFGGGGGGGFGGGRSPLRADLPTLQQVAQLTGGMAYTAENADQLEKVFTDLPKDVTVQKERREVTSAFAAIGALLALVAVGASIRWSPYP